MAERLIDAEALKHKRVIATYGNLEQGIEEREVVYVEDIDNAPTIEAKPIVHAHWEEFGISKEGIDYICSECAFTISADEYPKNAHYCPWCGAQMDEVVSDNNVGSKTEGVKIPVISMEDVPKLAKESD